MKYKAKDVCDFLNLNKETLRYYEKIQLIFPEIDSNSHYRYYNDWDIEMIVEYRKLRSLNHSIKEIKIVNEVSGISEMLQVIEDKQSYFKDQALFYNELFKISQDRIKLIKDFKKNHKKIIIDISTEFYLDLAYDYNNFSEGSIQKYNNFTKLKNADFAFIDFALIIEKEEFFTKKHGNLDYSGGTIFTSESMNFLNSVKKGMIHLPRRRVMKVNIETDLHINLIPNLFEKAKNFIAKENLKVVDNIIGIQIAKIKDIKNGNGKRLFQLHIPIN